TGSDAQLAIDASEMGLNSAWRDEEPGGDIFVGESSAHEPRDLALCGRHGGPAAGGPLASTAAPLRVRPRLLGGQRGTLSPGSFKFAVAQCLTQRPRGFLVRRVVDLKANLARSVSDRLRRAEQSCCLAMAAKLRDHISQTLQGVGNTQERVS